MFTSQPVAVLTVQMCIISVDANVIPIWSAETRTTWQINKMLIIPDHTTTPSLVTYVWTRQAGNKAQCRGPQTGDRRRLKNRNTFACALTQVLELATVCCASRISPLTVTYCYSLLISMWIHFRLTWVSSVVFFRNLCWCSLIFLHVAHCNHTVRKFNVWLHTVLLNIKSQDYLHEF